VERNLRLHDRVAIVTGGAMGIGEGIAREFLAEGAKVLIADVNEEAGRDTAERLKAQDGRVESIRCDVSSEEDVRSAVDAAESAFGALHVVVNNAALGVYKPVTEATLEEFERCLAVNVGGVFLMTKHGAPRIEAAGGGAIVNIASVHSVQNVGGTAPYAASKGAVAALTRASAIDLAKSRVRVNAICPGWIYTPLIRGIFESEPDPERMKRSVEQRQLLGRLGEPREVGRAAVFLASDDSSYVTGSLLFVDNGMTAQLETWTGEEES
jgi:NAD(P)-dependent dehydrogenase (short-subunit alcohol dehydrogenase family)